MAAERNKALPIHTEPLNFNFLYSFDIPFTSEQIRKAGERLAGKVNLLPDTGIKHRFVERQLQKVIHYQNIQDNPQNVDNFKFELGKTAWMWYTISEDVKNGITNTITQDKNTVYNSALESLIKYMNDQDTKLQSLEKNYFAELMQRHLPSDLETPSSAYGAAVSLDSYRNGAQNDSQKFIQEVSKHFIMTFLSAFDKTISSDNIQYELARLVRMWKELSEVEKKRILELFPQQINKLIEKQSNPSGIEKLNVVKQLFSVFQEFIAK